jgi:hypothetical protein
MKNNCKFYTVKAHWLSAIRAKSASLLTLGAWLGVVSLLSAGTAHGQTLYVANDGNQNDGSLSIGEYNAATGAPVNGGTLAQGGDLTQPWGLAISGNTIYCSNPTSEDIVAIDATTGALVGPNGGVLVSNLLYPPLGLAVSGNTLFVAIANGNTPGIGEYNINTGAPVSTGTLVSFVDSPAPTELAVAGTTLYVTLSNNTIGEYNVNTGAPVNGGVFTSTDLNSPTALAISGSTLYVTNTFGGVFGDTNTITEYNLNTGAELNGGNPLVTDAPTDSDGLAVYDNTLYVSSFHDQTITAYNATTGAELNGGEPLIASGYNSSEVDTGPLQNPIQLFVVAPVPEPSTWAMLALGGGALLGLRRCRIRA